jgi:hypothetical protein
MANYLVHQYNKYNNCLTKAKMHADRIAAADQTFLRNVKLALLHFLPTRHPDGMLADLENTSRRDVWLVEKMNASTLVP